MGEGEESLEDLVDLFPEVQDEPECGAAHHRHRHETDGFHPPAPNHETSATFQHEEILPSPPHALPRTGSLDFHQILGTDQDAEMMGILTHNNSSWSTQPNAHESSGLARRAPWEDFPLSHDNSISHDEDDALHSHNARGEGRFDRNTGGGYGKGKENAQDDHDPKRRGTRKRKATSRFDPVEAEVEPMRYADNGRTADGVRSASKRPTRVKMEEEREEPAEVKIEEESEQESEEEEKQQKKAKKKKTSIVHARAVPVGLRASRSPSASSSSRSPSASSSSRKGAASRKVGRPPHQEKCAASSQQTRATIQQEGMQRGRHVGHKPQMQKTARAGQKRWKQVLAKMRAEAARIPASKTFTIQMTQCKRMKLKSQKEALLLFLNAAARDGLIRAGKFCDVQDASRGFVGWTSFCIIPRFSTNFYRKVQNLFGEGSRPKTNTVHNIFRRAGLVPTNWANGWKGHFPFVYRQKIDDDLDST